MNRPLSEIANDVFSDWNPVSPYALPYLEAMQTLNSIEDNYIHDTGSSVVAYFLSNATSWKGPVARGVKMELKKMLNEHYKAHKV